MGELKLFISAGDPSGERHAARLIRELKALAGPLEISGIGGPAMEEEGARLVCSQDRLAVMGLAEVVSHLGFFWRLLRTIRRRISENRPDLIVLIDFPDFNLRLAGIAKKAGIPVLYYISPQVWAWRGGRKRSLARLVDRMAVVFPFEAGIYRGEDLEVEFVGHPLTRDLAPKLTLERFCSLNRLDPQRPLVGLMPGSRTHEVSRHLELFLAAARRLRERRRELQFAAGLLPHTAAALTRKQNELLRELEVRQVTDDSLSLIAHSRLLLTKSGTTTMEAALLGTPMVIVYRTSHLSFLIARRLVKVRHIGMPNLLVSDPQVPELIQDQARPDLLAQKALELLDDSSAARQRILRQYAEVRKVLTTEKGASRRVAEIVLEMCRPGRQL